MKTNRFLLAAAITLAAAACSSHVTAPDAVLHAPADAHQNAAAPDTSTGPAPTGGDDGGHIGSGVGR
jgi:hypothetical protein